MTKEECLKIVKESVPKGFTAVNISKDFWEFIETNHKYVEYSIWVNYAGEEFSCNGKGKNYEQAIQDLNDNMKGGD